MEEEHTPETDLTRCHQVLGFGGKFESSLFVIGEILFSVSRESRPTLVAGFLE